MSDLQDAFHGGHNLSGLLQPELPDEGVGVEAWDKESCEMKIKPTDEMMKSGVKGIFVNGCVLRGEGSSFRARAHAHNMKGDPPQGWICFRSLKRIRGITVTSCLPDWDGELVGTNQIIMHEYAHILTPNHGHDDTWRKAMKDLGQPIRAQYRKRTKQ